MTRKVDTIKPHVLYCSALNHYLSRLARFLNELLIGPRCPVCRMGHLDTFDHCTSCQRVVPR